MNIFNNNKKPLSIEELRKQTKSIKDVNIAYKEKLSTLDRMALFITDRVGSVGFFLIIFSWTLLWLFWNVAGPEGLRFDPYPAFVLWLFISNMIQLFLLPILLVGQNLQNKRFELRSEIDFEISLKSEKEIETILKHLEHENDAIISILQKLENLEKKNKADAKK